MAQLTINYKPADKTYDVIVAGGGTAGVMAACAAAREGARVIILEREYALGGTSTLALTVPRQIFAIFTNDPEQERQCRLDVRFKIYNEQ